MQVTFKVWCHNKNEWETDACFLSQNGIVFHMDKAGRMIPLKPDTHTASFFIGIYDCNEIYSADILKVSNTDEQIQNMEIICTLEFLNCIWYLVINKVNIWEHYQIEPYPKYHKIPFSNFLGCKKIEKIGNIFENANLLE